MTGTRAANQVRDGLCRTRGPAPTIAITIIIAFTDNNKINLINAIRHYAHGI